MKKASTLVLASCLALAAASGCEGPGAYAGENGDIDFRHETGTAFTSPKLVVGGELSLGATDADNDRSLAVLSATSTDSSVVEVLDSVSSKIVVRGNAVGQAELYVEVEGIDGSPMSDTLVIDVREPARHELDHVCTDAPSAYYLPNRTYTLPARFFGANDERLAGERVTFIEQEGEGVDIDLDRSTTEQLAVRTRDAGATSTIRSTVNDDELVMGVRDFAEADGLAALSLSFGTSDDDEQFRVGELYGLTVQPTVGASPICGYDLPMVVELKTPEVCALADGNGEEITERSESETNILLMAGTKVGTCELDVTLTDPQTEATLQQTISVEILAEQEE